ncbi:MAG TPA: LacI family DNA-binding transcriptional regulator [Galbitalea sp.]|nr:LacI family DNA-binding transcriptional regulator [Galbitalea sp.]
MPQKPSASVTLKDVAERVGVTSAAASMALSDHSRISEKTKEAVRKAAAELGYVPSSVGRALRNQRAGAIALIVPNTSQHVFGHSYFMHVLTGISTAANARDVQVLLSTTADTGAAGEVAAYERVVRSRSADGAIVTSAAVTDAGLEALVATGLPVVLIGNFPYLADAVTVGIDDIEASREITAHLLDVHGRSRLVHVTGPLDHQTGIDRRDGFVAAVEADGVGNRAVIIEGDFSEESGEAAVQKLLADGTEFDGIVFANDDMAFGGLAALKAQGVRVPEDVAIVGFDDFGLSRLTTPGITTVHVPAEEMARIATERLFELIAGSSDGPSHQHLPVVLVERESCGTH